MEAKIDKISDKVFEKSEYLSVGQIALKEGNIPYERIKGEKAYRIPSAEYYQSLSHDRKSIWFQNHTRE
jgi:hypothetical protein